MRRVHVEWGPVGAAALARSCEAVVICDVLSFSTTVCIAASRGIEVWPVEYADGETAAALAAAVGAVVAGPRGSTLSLSPASMTTAAPGSRVVIPSPNGAACCLAADTDVPVAAGCLRNATAVARWLRAQRGDVGIVAAGERWPDGSLRPAYEDWVGAGSVAGLLTDGFAWTPEAEAAALAASRRRSLREVASGVELVERGFAADVELAEAYDADDVVPVLRDGRFVAA